MKEFEEGFYDENNLIELSEKFDELKEVIFEELKINKILDFIFKLFFERN